MRFYGKKVTLAPCTAPCISYNSTIYKRHVVHLLNDINFKFEGSMSIFIKVITIKCAFLWELGDFGTLYCTLYKL